MCENTDRKLSLNVSRFDTLINENKIYVDKTKFIKKMVDDGFIYYFLSRPRRFGKTLLISTIENLFACNKELFKGLYIYDKWDWEEYPVLHLDMSELNSDNKNLLELTLTEYINEFANEYNIKLDKNLPVAFNFSVLIKKISKSMNKKLVVLIDEYDEPILSQLNNKEIADANRKLLQDFYNVLKTSEEYLKFVFITGITKFTKTSIFSKLNNLTELTMDKNYSNICGINHSELEYYYKEYIQAMANELNYTYQETLDKINYYYDGYSWDGENRVFNPYSTILAFKSKKFSSFWFSTGTPTFIAEIFKKKKITEDYFKPTVLEETDLDAINLNNINETTLLFQGGYLTIEKEFIENGEIYYSLKIPNFEVKTAFKKNLTKLYINEFKDKYTNLRKKLWEDINNYKCENLANRLQDDININPSYLNIGDKENWKIYESLFLQWMNIMGFDVTGEKLIKHGRIDGVFKDYDNNHVIICEVKYTQNSSESLDKLIKEALTQLKDEKYWMGYTTRKISLFAIAFKDEIIHDDKTMTLVKCKIENFNPKEYSTKNDII
jgi:hypothetical protein